MSTTTDIALTSEQIKAMRNADYAVHVWEEQVAPEDASGYARRTLTGHIRLGKEVERKDGFGRETLHVEVPTRVLVQDYSASGMHGKDHMLDRPVSGSWYCGSLQVSPEWGTVVAALRPGDTLVQDWVVDNRNDLLANAHLTVHELKLRVERPAKDGRIKRFTYMLDMAVRSPFNSADAVTRVPR